MDRPLFSTFNSGWWTFTLALGAALLFAGSGSGQSAGHLISSPGQTNAEKYKFTARGQSAGNLKSLPRQNDAENHKFFAFGQNAGIANPSPGQSEAENYKFAARSNLVSLPTRVQSKRGETIYGLKPEQFIVEDNGVRQSVQVDEDPDTWGVSLVVAVQCSRAAPKEFNKLKGLGAMIEGIVGDAPHEVAILSYGERPYVLDDFSANPEAVPLALSRIRDCGEFHAAAIDAVAYAINMLRRRQNHYRRAILLIGETRDHGSHSKLHEVVAELGVTDTVIYTVAFSPARDEIIEPYRNDDHPPQDSVSAPPPTPPHPPPAAGADSSPAGVAEPVYTEHVPLFVLPPELQLMVSALRRNAASELASLSGGEYVNFTTQRGFERSLQRISNQIHDYYVLSFKPSSGAPLSLHSLRVRVAGYPDAVIQTRRSYWSGIFEASSGDGR
jgi:VWFA-related protein